MPALLPDERELLTVRQHRVIIFRRPPKWVAITYLILLVLVYFAPWPMIPVLAVLVLLPLLWRWYQWREERIVLTSKRLIRVAGVPETTEIEAFLRVDRIAGVVLVQSVLGRFFDYGDLHLEAPGDHQILRELTKVSHIGLFYRELRAAAFGQRSGDPDAPPSPPPTPDYDYITEPLPLVQDLPPWRRTDPPPTRRPHGRG